MNLSLVSLSMKLKFEPRPKLGLGAVGWAFIDDDCTWYSTPPQSKHPLILGSFPTPPDARTSHNGKPSEDLDCLVLGHDSHVPVHGTDR